MHAPRTQDPPAAPADWHPRQGPPEPVEADPADEPDGVEAAMRAELPFRSAAVVAQAWSEARRWIAWGGEPVVGAAQPPARLPLPLAPVAHRLRRLQREVREPRRGPRVRARMGTVAVHCAGVSAWAEGRGAGRTALAFARLAARAEPEAPRHAYDVGRLARRRGDHQAAWRWLRWAAALARRAGDRDTFARALAGTAALYGADGQLRRAERYWKLALLHARELGPWEVEEESLLALAVLTLRRGDLAAGLELARRALDVLSPHDGRVAVLLREVSLHLIDTFGLFAPALLVLDALLPHHAGAGDRLALHALRARAAAGAGLPGRFEASWSAAVALAGGRRVGRRARGDALLWLARAAAERGDWRRARHAAARARRAAPAGGVDEAGKLAELLAAPGDRAARWREEFPVAEAGEDGREEADRFALHAVEVLGARRRGEWACAAT